MSPAPVTSPDGIEHPGGVDRSDVLRIAASYDEVPYGLLTHWPTHPRRLATVARLRGLQPAPIERCRVLELGCAEGGNLVFLAATFPDSAFVGVDNSRRQIEIGKRLIGPMGLPNLSLLHVDILDVLDSRSSFGRFDYVIAHGLYSWVPATVQQAILDITRECLTDVGVGFISYNCTPGRQIPELLRGAVLERTGSITDVHERIAVARDCLRDVADRANRATPFGSLVAAWAEHALNESDGYLNGEYLSPVNEAFSLGAFATRVTNAGLHYLDDALILGRRDTKQDVRDEEMADIAEGTSFRGGLVCRSDARRSSVPNRAQLASAWVAAPLDAVADGASDATITATFRGRQNLTVTTRSCVVATGLRLLAQRWPADTQISELAEMVSAELDGAPTDEAVTVDAVTRKLVNELFALRRTGILEITFDPMFTTAAVSERPIANAAVRQLAALGRDVTNLRYEQCSFEPEMLELLALLDGERTLDDLATTTGVAVDVVSERLSILATHAMVNP